MSTGDEASSPAPLDRKGRHTRWTRADEPEYSRLTTFVDGVFAIALTLLVLDVRLPPLRGDADDPGAMITALSDLFPELVAYGVAFALLGAFWMAHHDFSSRLEAIDRRLMGLTLVYLAFVALLPFPTSLVGEHEENPVSVAVFAAVLAVISAMELVLFVHAHRSALMRQPLTPEQFRGGVIGSLQPVVIFVVTMPLAFVSPTITLLSWGVLAPTLGVLTRRYTRRYTAA